MTHRHMGYTCPITNVGHADLVQTQDGSWYAVMLASRLIGGNHKNLGWETFLCPVRWERDWPLFSPDTGKLEWEYDAPNLPEHPFPEEESFDDFNEENLRMYWTLWGTPGEGICTVRDSAVSLRCVCQQLDDELRPMTMDGARSDDNFAAFLARRQRTVHATATCKMRFSPENNERAGLAVVQAMNHQVHIEMTLDEGAPALRVVVVTAEYDRPPYFPGLEGHTHRETAAQVPFDGDEVVLQIEMDGQDWTVRYGRDRQSLQELTKIDGRVINPEKVGCMCGTLIGMFATGAGVDSQNTADFDWFELV